jgi:hypothetical protein
MQFAVSTIYLYFKILKLTMKPTTTLFKTLLLAFAVICATTVANAQSNLGVGTATPDASAKLDVTSTNQGILVPRMTTTARTAIATPAKGLMVYDSTIKAFYYHDGTNWGAVGGAGGGGASLQLFVTKNSAQTTQISSIFIIPDSVSFQTANTGTLTGGNTWNVPTNSFAFTVGPTGAGLYSIDVRLTGASILTVPMLDFGGAYATSSIYGAGVSLTGGGTGVAPSAYTKRGLVQTVMYLNAGASFKVRGLSSSIAIGGDLNGDASCRLTVVKLN